jgi:hypothetical protein
VKHGGGRGTIEERHTALWRHKEGRSCEGNIQNEVQCSPPRFSFPGGFVLVCFPMWQIPCVHYVFYQVDPMSTVGLFRILF